MFAVHLICAGLTAAWAVSPPLAASNRLSATPSLANSTSASAQPPRDRAEAKKATSIVRGRVVAADTGRPLRLARVSVTGATREVSKTIATDEQGRYEFRELPAGQYTLFAERNGYLRIALGQRRPEGPPRPLDVAEGQTLEKVDFALPRMSVISGRVTDEAGDPLERATVTAMRRQFGSGGKRFVKTGMGQTDASGTFRILGLPPGEYWVQAAVLETWSIERNGEQQTISYAPTYYPGTVRLNEAQAMRASVGQEISDVEFSMVLGRAITITGRAVDSHGAALVGSAVYLSQESITSANGSMGGVAALVGSSPVAGDGTFHLRNIPAGVYKLQARRASTHDGLPEAASVSITTSDSDVDGLIITTSPGGRLSGVVETETGTPPPFSTALRVIARQQTQNLVPLAPDPNDGRVRGDGTFAVSGLFGPSFIRVSGLPPEWALKAVFLGDTDVIDSPIDVSDRNDSALRIVLTNRLAAMQGSVTAPDGTFAHDYVLILFPDDRSRLGEESRFIRAVRPDQGGGFRLKGLPPADYWAVALEDVESGQWFDESFLEQLRHTAIALSLHEGEIKVLALRLRSVP